MDGNGSATRSGTTGLTPTVAPCVVESNESRIGIMNNTPAADAAILTFDPTDAAFALAWSEHVPHGHWRVFVDSCDEGREYITVETCSGLNVVGWHVLPTPDGQGVTATMDAWNGLPPTLYPSLRLFLATVHPLSSAALLDIEESVTRSMATVLGQRS